MFLPSSGHSRAGSVPWSVALLLPVVIALLASAEPTASAQPTPQEDAALEQGLDAGPGPDAGPTAPISDPLPPPASFDAQLTSVMPRPNADSILVGRSGQRYLPRGDTLWSREQGGGVSTNVEAMYRSSTGKLFAVGDRAPIFARLGGLWKSYPLARKGSSAANSGPRPVIALRKTLYQLGSTGWSRITTTPAYVDNLWASSNSSNSYFLISDKRGQIWGGRQGGWRRITLALNLGERITRLLGTGEKPGDLKVALTSEGRLFALGQNSGTLIPSAAIAPAFTVEALGEVNGILMVAGTSLGLGHLAKVVTTSRAQTSLVPLEVLWPIVPGDRYRLVSEIRGGLLVATGMGQARLRLGNGIWKNLMIVATAQPAPPATKGSGPALAH